MVVAVGELGRQRRAVLEAADQHGAGSLGVVAPQMQPLCQRLLLLLEQLDVLLELAEYEIAAEMPRRIGRRGIRDDDAVQPEGRIPVTGAVGG